MAVKMNNIKKIINKETFLYLVFGVLTTAVDFIAYIILTHLSVNYMLANVISWCFAVAFAYVTNKMLVFKSKVKDKNSLIDEILEFISARLFSLVFSLVFIYAVVTVLGGNDLVAKVLASVFVVIINYVLSKFYIFKNDEKNKLSIFDFISDNSALLVSFLLPLLILVVVYYARDIYPFGDNTYLRSDCYHQYAPFMKEFYNKLVNGRNMTYTWNIGLGTNFSALYSYYLASPVNWLIGLVSPNHIPEVMNIFIIIKAGLASLTFAYYLSNHFKTKKMSIAAISVFYALSSYFCAFSWNLMWLDCILLLPLIILGLERLVKENKCYLYCISLGVAILSNYYIAIMICIFCVIYYAALIYMDDAKKTVQYLLTRTKNFAIYSLLAGGFAAISVLPAFSALSNTASGEFDFPKQVVTYFSMLFMASRSLINVEPAVFSAHDPNLYCTVAVFILVPLFAVNPKIKFKDKIAKISILAILLISFNTNIPNYIWHGFHYPNSLPARESFLYIFLILVVSYEALINIKEVTRNNLMLCFAGAVGLILIIEEMFVDGEDYPSTIIYTSLMFIVFYMITIALLRNNNYKQSFVVYLLLIVSTAECYVNLDATALSTCTRSAYLNDNEAIEKLVASVNLAENGAFFRTEKEDRRTKNDAAWNDYHGASTFSSTAYAGVSKFYGSLGLEESTNAYAYYGHTPLTSALLSIKYVLSNSELKENEYITLFDSETYDVTNYIDDKVSGTRTYYMYKNNYVLPLGLVMPSNVKSDYSLKDPNPFSSQNTLCTAITGDETPMYTRLGVDTFGEDNIINIEEDMHLFIYVTTSLDSIKVTIRNEDGTNRSSKSYFSMTHSHILDLGTFKAGESVSVASSDDEVKSIQLYAYSYDDKVFNNVFNKLNTSPMEITKYTDTTVDAKIDVKEDGMLYTSIPYDKGWKVTIDGKQVDTYGFADAMLAFDISSGEHTIKLEYSPVGFIKGLLLSVFCTVTFILIVITNYYKEKRRNKLMISEEIKE